MNIVKEIKLVVFCNNPNTVHGSFIHCESKIVQATYLIPETANPFIIKKMGEETERDEEVGATPLCISGPLKGHS